MSDVPGNSTTTSTLSLGSTVDGLIEVGGDHDWYKIQLTGGQTISIAVNGSGGTPLEDPYVRVRDAAGNVVFENDDGGPGRNALLTFEVPSSGTYYVDVAAWDDETGSYQYTGGYQLSAKPYTPPPVGSVDQFATQLVSGYWEGASHHFNVAPGGSLTVNLTDLTVAGQSLARTALAQWTEVIGVTFTEVTTGGHITFDDNEEGAHADANWTGNITTSAHVNISADWLADYGTGVGSYSYQTYVHEIGHALGLGHAGNYNGDATYPYDSLYSNDGWPMSVMSYFSPSESSYYSSRGYSDQTVVTPMLADIVAMQQLYGASTTTRTGNTTYGFNSNAGNPIYNASQYSDVSLTIVDSGGTDTLDYSLYSGTQRIDLNQDQFSNVLGGTGNLAIGRGVTIENAIGGSGFDTIIGNAAANVLTGGAGNDSLSGGDAADTLNGGSGDDSLNGGSGADLLRGGIGNDEYRVENLADVVQELAGEGSDTVLASAHFALGAGQHVEVLRVEELGGTSGINLTGNELSQTLMGNEGANILSGGAGDDNLTSAGGNDTLMGGAGNDTLNGGNGTDLVDFWFASSALNVDLAMAGVNATGEGSDTLISIENIEGSGFFDTLFGTSGNNVILGRGGDDMLYGRDGSDTLFGSTGNDYLHGGADADRLEGGVGADILLGGGGNDILDGGDGTDVVDFWFAGSAVTVDLAGSGTNATGEGSDTLISIENLEGTGGADRLSGNAIANLLLGRSGDDILFGRAGADVLFGGAGNDHLDGGADADRLEGASGNDTLAGGLGDDILDGGEGVDAVDYWLATSGVMVDLAGSGTNAVGEGTDTLIAIENLEGSGFNDRLYGNAQANVLLGRGGDDTLLGRAGTDVLFGGAGNDRLEGGDDADRLEGGLGADTLLGGLGDDVLTGESDADRFVIAEIGGTDRITDFASGGDLIDLSQIDANSGIAGDQAFTFVGSAGFSGAGQVRTYVTNGTNYAAGDVNGDGIADFLINLGSSSVQVGDFLL